MWQNSHTLRWSCCKIATNTAGRPGPKIRTESPQKPKDAESHRTAALGGLNPKHGAAALGVLATLPKITSNSRGRRSFARRKAARREKDHKPQPQKNESNGQKEKAAPTTKGTASRKRESHARPEPLKAERPKAKDTETQPLHDKPPQLFRTPRKRARNAEQKTSRRRSRRGRPKPWTPCKHTK